MALDSPRGIEFRLNGLIGAINRLADRIVEGFILVATSKEAADNKPVLDAIQALTNILETKMATQEERLQAVAAQLVEVQAGVDRIQAALAELKANNPQLEDEISSIEAQVSALGTDVAEATPPPAPTA